MWEQAWRLAGEADRGRAEPTEPILLESVLDELRLEGDAFKHAQQAAILRTRAITQSYIQGFSNIEPPDIPNRDQWMRANNLDEVQLAGLEILDRSERNHHRADAASEDPLEFRACHILQGGHPQDHTPSRP